MYLVYSTTVEAANLKFRSLQNSADLHMHLFSRTFCELWQLICSYEEAYELYPKMNMEQ